MTLHVKIYLIRPGFWHNSIMGQNVNSGVKKDILNKQQAAKYPQTSTRYVEHRQIAAMVAKSARENLEFEIANYVTRPMTGNKLDGSRETIRQFATGHFDGKRALRHITGIRRLNGPRGAMAWYWQFLVDCRVSPAPQGIDPELWSQHVKAYAQSEVYRVRREGLPGYHVLNDCAEYRCYRARENGKAPARGFVKIAHGRQAAHKTSNNTELRKADSSEPWDGTQDKPINWTPSEKRKGIPRSIAGGNFKDCQIARMALQRELENRELREYLIQSRAGLMVDEEAIRGPAKAKFKAREPDDI